MGDQGIYRIILKLIKNSVRMCNEFIFLKLGSIDKFL
jgi:hypothetical protein